MFGMDVFPDEGSMNHSLHTAIIDRTGKVAANIEGNQFTAPTNWRIWCRL
jgi:protein SCO1